MAAPKDPTRQSIAQNRRARYEYEILETWEAGIVLTGTEVKALRSGKANISDAYGLLNDGEVFLLNLHISPYERGGYVPFDRSTNALGTPLVWLRKILIPELYEGPATADTAPDGLRLSANA